MAFLRWNSLPEALPATLAGGHHAGNGVFLIKLGLHGMSRPKVHWGLPSSMNEWTLVPSSEAVLRKRASQANQPLSKDLISI
jgi:hypothetical protein